MTGIITDQLHRYIASVSHKVKVDIKRVPVDSLLSLLKGLEGYMSKVMSYTTTFFGK